MEYIDLLMENGELVRIEVPDKHADACYEALETSMKRKDWWCPSMFDGAKAEYMGLSINRVAMNKVVGML